VREHPGVHEAKYSRRRAKSQNKYFERFMPLAPRNEAAKVRLVFTRDSTTEMRVSAKQDFAGYAGVVQRCPKTGQFAARGDALVYSGKPQTLENQGEVVENRRRGRTLTAYARHTVREAAATLGLHYEKKVAFITLTIPGGTKAALDAVAVDSRYVLNLFLQRLRNRAATDLDYAGVWEWQERGALHIHMALACPDENEFAYIEANHRHWWYCALQSLSDRTGVDVFERREGGSWKDAEDVLITQCAWVEKDVGRYMSKYVTKGSGDATDEQWIPPGRWWFVSKPLWEKVKAQRWVETFDTDGYAHAWELLDRAIGVGMSHATHHYEWRNPITKELKGMIMYFDEGDRHNIFLEMTDAVEGARDARDKRVLWRHQDTGELRSDPMNFSLGELTLWYEVDEYDDLGYADFSAPFSASEKGGGMR
jgi:hypothetical protein